MGKGLPKPKLTLAAAALVAANLVPIAGAVLLGWDLFALVFLYWLENGVIGFYNVLKMAANQSPEPGKLAQKAFLIPFFCVHYGGFFSVHGVFVLGLFGGGFQEGAPFPTAETVWRMVSQHGLVYALAGLVLSHGVSFVTNYIRGGEYKDLLLGELMAAPYGRVVVLHLGIMGGGFLVMMLGSPQAAVVLLAVLKTGGDLLAHAHEHRDDRTRRLKARFRKLYEAGLERKGEVSLPPALAAAGYTHDRQSERLRQQTDALGCGTALALFVGGIVLIRFVSEPIGIGVLGAGLALGALATVLHNIRRAPRCRTCGGKMEVRELDVPPERLSVAEKATCHTGPGGETLIEGHGEGSPQLVRPRERWFVCPACRSSYLGTWRSTRTVALGDREVAARLRNTTPYVRLAEDDAEPPTAGSSGAFPPEGAAR